MNDKQDLVIDEVIRLVNEFFDNDKELVRVWLAASNPNLGNSSPWKLMFEGRASYVLSFVKAQIEEGRKQ